MTKDVLGIIIYDTGKVNDVMPVKIKKSWNIFFFFKIIIIIMLVVYLHEVLLIVNKPLVPVVAPRYGDSRFF